MKNNVTTSSQQLLNWIKSLNGQNCKQVQSFLDLRSGIVLGEIVSEIYQQSQILQELNYHNLVNPNNCIANLNNIICEIKCQCNKNGVQFPTHLQGITPAHLYEEQESIQTFCEWLFLQKKLMQMRINGTFQNQQKNSIKRPPMSKQNQIQQNKKFNCEDDDQVLDQNPILMTFQPHQQIGFGKSLVEQSHNSIQQSNQKVQQTDQDELNNRHFSSRSSEPELFYASDLNFVHENNHFESFNDEQFNKQSTLKQSLENSYQVLRPSSPYQTGSFKQKQQNAFGAQKVVQFDQDASFQKQNESDQFADSKKMANNYFPFSQSSSAQSSAIKGKAEKSSQPLQQQDLANSFDSSKNVMKVSHYLNDTKNNKVNNSNLQANQLNEESLSKNNQSIQSKNNQSIQSKKGYEQQENNQRQSNLQLPPQPNSSKPVKSVKPNQNHHQHSNSFNLQSNQTANTSIYSVQSSSAQKCSNIETSDKSKIQSQKKEVQKISANFSVNQSSGYLNGSFGAAQGGIMNSQSKEKLKREIEQLDLSIKEEQINTQGTNRISNKAKQQVLQQQPNQNTIINSQSQNQQNFNKNIPNSASSRLSYQSNKITQEQTSNRNENSSQQLSKNRSNQSLVEPTQYPNLPVQKPQNLKKQQGSLGGNQYVSSGSNNSNTNSRMRSYSHQQSTSNNSESAANSEIFSCSNNNNNNQNEHQTSLNQQNKDKVKPLQIFECNDQQKERCLKWLYDICLIKKDIKDIKEKLPKVCKNGVIFLDIINRIQGKGDTITGINRNTKNMSQIRANYTKLFYYLRKFEKMNPRYLFNSEEYLMEGNSDIFWGLLDDIWHLFHSKQSPFDKRSESYALKNQKNQQKEGISQISQPDKIKNQQDNYNQILFNNSNTKSGNKLSQNFNEDQSSVFNVNNNPSSCSARIVKTLPNDSETGSLFNKKVNGMNDLRQNEGQNPVLKTQGSSKNMSINGGGFSQNQQNVFTPKYKQQRNGNSQQSPIPSPKSIQNMNYDNLSQKVVLTRQNTSSNLNQSYTSQRKSLTNLNANNSSYKKLSNYKDIHTQRQTNAVIQFNTPTRRCLSRRTSRDFIINQSQSPSVSRQRINTVHTFNHNSVNYSHQNNNNNSFLKFNSQSKLNQNNNSFHTAFSPCTNRTPSKGINGFGFNQNTPKVIAITLEMEIQTNQFLNKLGFNQYIVKKDKHLFEDPLRNGTLLCKLVEKLNQRVDRYFAKPKNIEECRFNIESALQPLRSVQESINIPFYLLFKTEEILKGEHDAIWGLLYNLMKNQENIRQADPLTQVIAGAKNEIYPANNGYINEANKNKNNEVNDEYNKSLFGGADQYSPVSVNRQKNEEELNQYKGGQIDITQDIHLPYSADQIYKLEASLIKWINQKCGKLFTSFQPIYNSIRNGVLLCSLISSILNRLISPSHQQPTSDHNCLANIQKALVPLRNMKNMGQKFLWKENLILQQNQSVILGLLEDLRRYSDGLPARKGDKYFEEGPYFGFSFNKENQYPPAAAAPSQTDRNMCSNNSSFRNQRTVGDSVTFCEDAFNIGGERVQLNNENKFQQNLLSKLNNQKPYSLFKESFEESNFSSDSFNQKFPQNQFINRAYQLIQENAQNIQNSNINQQINQIVQKELNQPQQKPKGLLDNFQQKQKQILEEHNNPSINNIQYPYQQQNQSITHSNITFQKQQNLQQESENQSPSSLNILNWLNEIGLQDISKSLDLNSPVVQSFKDGLVICKIIEKLDQTRIPGLINNPKTSASCLVNIRKAFFILQKKTDFDPKLLLDETLVYEAKNHFVVNFLNQLKHAFKNQYLYLKRLKKNEQIRDISINLNK
ncbi:hypothetical protein TTHERM_00312780 (macronuclear) [Tetrahymena thermophila SB210]|uniref:Calponin-homology (CH) domain-containing protein n=1 Tax=Tetrahymena thermophila (strain SB210) TaxID=312017 RepID=Q22KK3_TETTS|nr:hypothetical protein TTHERM_00312780 [Tetrahymena thermophila SB210]EAR85796.2 hypothetical protein TTHERM_00312780 [Tetrahymena thermophila SB210]|eukprot:XP_001033459.2 hypothetical protein TTHERM_00312780 [Tetrahymena thermophila SB210]